MDRVLEAHYAPPKQTMASQKEKVELLRKSRDMQDSRGVRSIQTKHAKSLEKNRGDSEARGKGAEKNGRERHSLGRS